jgi:hypothetical protein
MNFLSILIVLAISCASLQQQRENKTAPPQRKELQLNIPKGIWEPIFFKAVNERAKLSDLKTLRRALPEQDFEVRVWHGFGLTLLEGFVLKRTHGKWSALYLDGISPGMPRNQYQRILRAPKSGWNASWDQLEDAGILILPDASAVGCSAMDEDGMSYVVEFNRDRVYRTYMYDNPDDAKCDEAKRMIKIGNIIAEEFGVSEMARNE